MNFFSKHTAIHQEGLKDQVGKQVIKRIALEFVVKAVATSINRKLQKEEDKAARMSPWTRSIEQGHAFPLSYTAGSPSLANTVLPAKASWESFGFRPQSSNTIFPNMPNTYGEGAKMLEDCFTAVYWLARSRTMTDVAMVLGTLARAITGKSVLYSVLTSDLIAKFKALFHDDLDEQSSWTDSVKDLREGLTKFEMVRNSKMYKKLHQLLMYVLSFGMCANMGVTFDKLRYSRLESEAIKKDFTSTTNFLVCIVDTCVFICERGITYMRTGRWTSMLHSGDKYEEWYEQALQVKEFAKLLNDPELHGFDEPEFVRKITDVRATGKIIYEEAKIMSMAERRFVLKTLHEIEHIHNEFLNSVKARLNRDVPYSLLVAGESSIGKSNIVSLLFAMFAKWEKLPEGEEYIYTLMPNDEFWSGFQTFMWGLSMDDMGALAPTLAQAGLDKMLMQIISIVNTVPLVTNQAALESKGNVPFRGKCVIATANTTHLNSQFVYTCPIAALRRLPIVIEPSLKDDYMRDGMLNQEAARLSGLQVPDFYNFKVSRVVPQYDNGKINHASRAYKIVEHNGRPLDGVGLVELLCFLRDDIARHNMAQTHVRGEREKYVSMSLCECHRMPTSLCLAPQAGERNTPELVVPTGVGASTAPPRNVQPAQDEDALVVHHGAAEPPPNATPYRGQRLNNTYVETINAGVVVTTLWGRHYTTTVRSRHYVCRGLEWVESVEWFGDPDPFEPHWHILVPAALLTLWCVPVWGITVVLAHASRYSRSWLPQWMVRFLDMVRLAHNQVVNQAVAAGVRPMCQFLLRQVVQPDTYMRRIYLWCIATPASFLVTQVFWLGVLAAAHRGSRVATWMVMQIMARLPLFLVVYMAPIFGVTWLAADRVRAVFRAIGDREAAAHTCGRMVLATLASFVAMRAAVVVMTKLQTMMWDQTSFNDEAKEPTPCEADVTRANVWQKDDYKVTPNDVGKKACGAKPMSRDEFATYLGRNVVFIASSTPELTTETFFRALGLTDNVYVTNTHNFRAYREKFGWYLRVVWTQQNDQISSNVAWTVDEADIMDLDHDLTLFRIPVRPPVRNIMEYIPSRTLRGMWNGYRIIRQGDGALDVEKRTAFQRDGEYWVSQGKPSHAGHCGIISVVETPYGPQIVGIHRLGSDLSPVSKSIALERETLQAALDKFAPLAVQGQGHTWEVGDLHAKAAVRFIERGHLDVYGSVPSFSANKSKVQLSSTARFFMERGHKLEHGQPVLRGWEPQRRALLGVVEPKSVVPTGLIREAVRDYVDQVRREVRSQDFAVIHMVDEKTAILGMPGIPHMERLAMSTSSGYPFNVPKRECISDEGTVTDASVRAEIDRIQQCYERGERAYPIFNACYKDEPTAFKKIAINKTRVFLISNLAFTVVCRQLLMGHIRFFTSHRFQCEMAIGINCYSEEWGELRDYLTHFGDAYCDDGDFAGFDSSQGAPWLLGAFDILTELAREAGCSTSYLLKLQCLKHDLIFALVNWFGTLIQFTKQNPSGNSMTTQLNCLVISLLMRCAFIKLRRERGLPQARFRDSVHLIGYGDDSAQNVHPAAHEYYNHVVLEKVLAEFGYEFTMAQKDAVGVPFRPMHEIGFLKRVWRWDDDVNAWLAPLDKKSISKSLLMCMPSKAVCEEKRATDCLSSALREHFMHGREDFEAFRQIALECVVECALQAYVTESTFPTYEELQAQFYEASKHVYVRQGRVAPVQLTLPAAQTTTELLLVEQGGVCTKSVAVVLSHEGVPQSRFLPESSLDSKSLQIDDEAEASSSSIEIQPAIYKYPYAGAALKASLRHLRETHPNHFVQIFRNEEEEACLCGMCRPGAYDAYKCEEPDCDICLDMCAPTEACLCRDGVNTSWYWQNWKDDAEDPRYHFRSHAHDVYSFIEGVPVRFYRDCRDRWDEEVLVEQSGEQDVMNLNETAANAEDTHVVAHFVDDTEGVTVKYPPLVSDVRDGEHREIAELRNFLSRPVLISTLSWSETQVPPLSLGTLLPWYLFCNNSVIKNRLHNYTGIAGNLKIKFVVNASPFFYGAALAIYQPATNSPATANLTSNHVSTIITASQFPHVWIYPSAQQGGEITCPFFYPHNWLELTASSLQGMGFVQTYITNQLQSANGVAGASVTIQVWAWMEDVRLMGPTINLAVQSGRRTKDEYSKKPISSAASATAQVAKSLSRVPVIGPAATAVGEVASVIGDVASIFGFTKTPVLNEPVPFVPKPFANFASTDIGTTVEKLTLDSKNDLSIDPRIGGLPGDDEMALQGLMARESYLTSFTYTTSNNVDDLLFASFVKPHGLLGINTTGTYPLYVPTPLQYFSSMFEHWRGPIVFRFKIVSSPFHQGRVRFTFDPVGDISTNVPDYASVFNEVVDLATTSDFEVVVPYMQTIGWCRVWQDTTTSYKSNAPLGAAHVPGSDNGMVTIRAVNKLTAPTASSSIDIQVFVRAGEEFEVANPTSLQAGRTYLTIQSGEKPKVVMAYGDTHQLTVGDEQPQNHADLFTTNMGEKVASVRQLINRTNQSYATQYAGVVGTNQFLNLTMYQTSFPPWYGYSATGHHVANTQSGTPPTARFNFTPNTPWHYMVACCAGMRGSIQWHFNVDTTASQVVPSHFAITRHVNSINTGNYAESNTIATLTTNNAPAALTDWNYSAGAALTNTRTNTGLSVLAPFYNRSRFIDCNPLSGDLGQAADDSDRNNLRLRVLYNPSAANPTNVRIDRYFSAGPDFQCLFFLAAAPYSVLSSVTPA